MAVNGNIAEDGVAVGDGEPVGSVELEVKIVKRSSFIGAYYCHPIDDVGVRGDTGLNSKLEEAGVNDFKKETTGAFYIHIFVKNVYDSLIHMN